MSALAHQPDRFVALPFRRSEKNVPNWLLCVNYITTNHSSNYNSGVENAIRSMAEYHNTIVLVSESSDTKNMPTENYINGVLKEHCRLVALAQAHLPLTSGGVFRVFEFFWRDSFDGVKYYSANSNLELVSCIYNLAASYCYIAVNQAQVGTVDSLRTAYNNFLNAAGYYVMTESLLGRLPSELVVRGDLKHDSLTMLKQICVAQAHHCGYLRFECDASKTPEVRARVAAETAKQYEEAHSQMRNSSWFTGKGTNAKEVELQLNAAVQLMWARAHLHMAAKHESEQDTGTAIAYYNRAKEYLARVPKMPHGVLVSWVNSIVGSVNEAHKRAEESNRSIFYSRVPQSVPVPEGLPRPLGQPTEHPSFVEFTSTRATDPFFGIVPSHITQAVLQWRDKQRKLVDVAIHAALRNRTTVQQKLQELGVMAAVTSMTGEVRDRGRVPEQLRERVLEIQREAAAAKSDTNNVLVQHVSTCDQLYQVLQDKIKEVEVELGKEKEIDEVFLKSYGEKIWRAVYPAADQLAPYGALTATIAKHKSEVQQYLVAPFSATRARCDANLRDVGRLSWSITDLDALMPFADTPEAREQSTKIADLVEKLRQLLGDKDALEKEQQESMERLKQRLESDDVTYRLSAAGAAAQETIFASFSKDIADAIAHVNEHTRNEWELIGKANAMLEQLGVLRSADPLDKEAAEVVRSLENACTVYKEVVEQFKQVALFAASAIDAVERTMASAKSFTMSRKMQADEVAQRLDRQIAEKLSHLETTRAEMAKSQQRQQELQIQIALLESARAGHGAPPPNATTAPPNHNAAAAPADLAPPSYDSLPDAHAPRPTYGYDVYAPNPTPPAPYEAPPACPPYLPPPM